MRPPPRPVRLLWATLAALVVAGVATSGTSARASETSAARLDSTTPSVEATVTSDAARAAVGRVPGAGGADGQVGIESQQATSVPGSLGDRLRGLLGIVVILLLAWSMSVNRSKIPWRILAWGLALQVIFALFILKTPVGLWIFDGANRVVIALLGFTEDGARFIFGDLVHNNIPVGTGEPGSGSFTAVPGTVAHTGSFFAFNVLPTIIFFSSLMTVLYYLGIMQWTVKGFAWIMQRTMRTSGAETLSAAGNIFVGQTEAPLLIKPFVEKMTMSELMTVMTGGFATVAGGVLAAYVGLLVVYFPDIAGHLMAASVMSAPAALAIGKLMYPEEEVPVTAGSLEVELENPDVNVIDAAARGAHEGLHLALNVGAMLLAFIALVYLANGLVTWAGGLVGLEGLTIELILGWILAPLAWLMGVPWSDASTIAGLMGIKTVLNEFFAYLQLSGMLSSDTGLDPRSVIIATYALSGFANFSSIAIQIGGIGGIAPSRRHDLSRIGLRAMIAGSLAAFLTGTIAGIFV